MKSESIGLYFAFFVCLFIISFFRDFAALITLTCVTYLCVSKILKKYNYVGYLFFGIFVVSLSKDVTEFFLRFLGFLPALIVHFHELKAKIKNLTPYVVSYAMLISFKTFGYAAIPLAIYYYFKRYDSRILLGFAISLLIICSFVLNYNEKFANELAIYSYYFLVLGVLGSIIEYLTEDKEYEAEDGSVKG